MSTAPLSDRRDRLVVAPEPTEEEAAAILAAYEALWPGPAVPAAAAASRTPRWRFSGRWWNAPSLTRRMRPG